MYEEKTTQAIKDGILSQLKTDIDRREGSFVDDMAGPVSLELFKMYSALNAVPDIVWVNENSGPYLDLAANDIGMEPRKEGVKAQVYLEVTGPAGFQIPAETAFLTEDRLYFDSIETVNIPEGGPARIRAQAREAGRRYNVDANTILYVQSSSSNIRSVTNPGAAMGGTDPETDEELFDRLDRARKRPSTSGNIYDYEKWALEVSGIGAVKVYPLWDGPGTVKVLVADGRRRPVDQAVVDACFEHIEEVRPIGAEVTVKSAEPLQIDVRADVLTVSGISGDIIEEDFRIALDKHLEAIAFEAEEVRYSMVGAILISVEGVLDYRNLTLNGKTESIRLAEEQVPSLGEVAFTWI